MPNSKNPKNDDQDQDAIPLPASDYPDDDQLKHEQAESPAVKDSQDAFSGSMPEESPDIDEELEKVGLKGDDNDGNPTPLGGN